MQAINQIGEYLRLKYFRVDEKRNLKYNTVQI